MSEWVSEWVFYVKLAFFFSYIKETASYIQWDNNDVRFIPEQHFSWILFIVIAPQALVSFKKYLPPPLPYFKVNVYPFPLPHFASLFFAYLWSFHWPNYIVTLPRYFSFRLPHLNIPTGPPRTNWTRIFRERGLVYFSVTETDTATSGLV